jgi:hypothetical protein
MAQLEAMRQKDAAWRPVWPNRFWTTRVAAGQLEDPRAMLTRLNQLLETQNRPHQCCQIAFERFSQRGTATCRSAYGGCPWKNVIWGCFGRLQAQRKNDPNIKPGTKEYDDYVSKPC